MIAPPIWMVTGPRQVGKSSFCRGLAEAARNVGWDVAGLFSPPQIEQGTKIGILAEDLRTGESHRLASIYRQSPEDIPFGDWYFDPQTLAWGNRILESNPPCDLLIVDELGPLEFTQQIGWQVALKILPRGEYRIALVVIRPELQLAARDLFDFSEIIQIDPIRTTDAWVGAYWPKIMEYKIGL